MASHQGPSFRDKIHFWYPRAKKHMLDEVPTLTNRCPSAALFGS